MEGARLASAAADPLASMVADCGRAGAVALVHVASRLQTAPQSAANPLQLGAVHGGLPRFCGAVTGAPRAFSSKTLRREGRAARNGGGGGGCSINIQSIGSRRGNNRRRRKPSVV